MSAQRHFMPRRARDDAKHYTNVEFMNLFSTIRIAGRVFTQPFSRGRHRGNINPVSPADGGFILIPVILVVGLIGFIAMVLAKTEAVDVNLNGHFLRQAEAEAWANGVVQLTAYSLASSAGTDQPAQAFRTDGTPFACRIGKGFATVEVIDAAGLVDINFAPLGVLTQLFQSLDIPRADAAAIAANIIDFRSTDDIGEIKKASYAADGRPYGPKNGPFTTVGELEQVLGVTREIFLKVQPYITVESRIPYIDPNVASAQVLAMQLPDAPGAPKALVRTYIVRATVHNRGKAQFVREAAIEIAPHEPAGFLLRKWNRLNAYVGPSPGVDADEAPACLDLLTSR